MRTGPPPTTPRPTRTLKHEEKKTLTLRHDGEWMELEVNSKDGECHITIMNHGNGPQLDRGEVVARFKAGHIYDFHALLGEVSDWFAACMEKHNGTPTPKGD